MTQPDTIDAYLTAQCEKHQIPGLSVAVAQGGAVILARGYGLANVELSVPASDTTVYQLASVTKQFTASAIMLLVQDGKLTLDDHITALLPDLPAAWAPVTVRHLLTHTSGIKSYTSVAAFHKTLRQDFTPQELLALVADEPVEFAPGDRAAYNNTGYYLLGLLIESLSGTSYNAFLTERIFQPLGMTDTRVNDLRAIIPNRAHGYSWDGTTLVNGEYVSPTQPFAAGALVSTVRDLLRWDAALYTTNLLTQDSLDQMWTRTTLNDGTATDFGFGWMVEDVNGHRKISHSGGIPGFSTHIARFPDDALSVIVLINSDGANADDLAQSIAALANPALAKKPDTILDDPTPDLTTELARRLSNTPRTDDLFAPARRRLPTTITPPPDLGDFDRLDLLETDTTDTENVYRYRAVFARETLTLIAATDKEGTITRTRLRHDY